MNRLSTISVTGADAFEFLQAQLTNDLGRLDGEPEILAAWCSPKGRVIWFGRLLKSGQGYSLAAPFDTAADIVRRLSVFRFRSKVEFDIGDDSQTVDPAALIEDGIPFIGAKQVEAFTPHMLNLDLLDAISLSKGCYTGQEIVARTHYRGATRRRTERFVAARAVREGDKLMDGDRVCGEVLNVAGDRLLAVVSLADADGALVVDGVPIRRDKLPYL